jgi:hypothetical protein
MAAPSLTKSIKESDKKDRIDLRLYNTIVIFDVYTIARSSEAARDSILAAIASGDAKPSEVVAKELTSPGSVRASWVDQSPFVASDITDEEFAQLKGITTSAAFERFYQKR